MSAETCTLSQLHQHCINHGYPEEAKVIESYIALQHDEKTEDRTPPLHPRPAVNKAWSEALRVKGIAV